MLSLPLFINGDCFVIVIFSSSILCLSIEKRLRFVLFCFCFFFGGGGGRGGEGISDLWIYCFFNCNTSHFLYVASVKVTSCLRSILTVFSKQPNIHQICIENSKKNGKWQDRKTKKCFQDNILSKEELRGKKSK